MLRPVAESNAVFLDYWTALNKIVRVATSYARSDILPVIAGEKRAYHADARTDDWVSAAVALTHDAAGDNVKAYIEALRRQLEREAEDAAQKITTAATKEGARNTKKWVASVAAGANIDVGLLVRDDDLTDLLGLKVGETVSLVKNLSGDMADRIERLALGSILEGRGNRETEKLLSEIDGIGRRRAKLIARDQASKLNGAMNQFRQEQAGVTHFIWRTVVDGRERASHRARNGKTYAWDKPPSGERPGQQINCRCRASAVIVDEEDDFDDPDIPEAEEVSIGISTPSSSRSAATRELNTAAIEQYRANLEVALFKVSEPDEFRGLLAAVESDPEMMAADVVQLAKLFAKGPRARSKSRALRMIWRRFSELEKSYLKALATAGRTAA